MAKVTVQLPLSRETSGSLKYGVEAKQRPDFLISDIYLRKDKMEEAGHPEPWPTSITVTVEVAE